MTDDTPLHERDEWIPPECKVERLLQMPALASLAAQIGQSSNHDGTTSEHSAPTFGSRPAARLDIIDLAEGKHGVDEVWVHDERDSFKASILVRLFDDPQKEGALPRPFGVFYVNDRHTHETKMNAQVALAKEKKGTGDLDALLRGENVWTIG